MLLPEQFELALKRDRQSLFGVNEPPNNLLGTAPQSQTTIRSKRDELWEAKRKQREQSVVQEFPAGPPTVAPIINPLNLKLTDNRLDQLQQNFNIRRENMEQEFSGPDMNEIQQYNAMQRNFQYVPQAEPRVVPQPVLQQSPQFVKQYEILPAQRTDPQTDKRKQYLEELKQQVLLKEQKAKEERHNRIMKEREDLQRYAVYNPFGKEGSGAPLRDQYGNVISAKKRVLLNQQMLQSQAINHQPQQQFQPQPSNNFYPPYDALRPPHRQTLNFPQEENPYAAPSPSQMHPKFAVEQYQVPTQNVYYPEARANVPYNDYKANQVPIAFKNPQNFVEENVPMQAPIPQVNENLVVPSFVTKGYDPEKEIEKKQRALEMQKALEEQMRQRKEIKEKEKQTRELREKLEEEKILRERLEIEEKYKQEEEIRRKKIEDVRAENLALAEAKKTSYKRCQGKEEKEKRRVRKEPIAQIVLKETKEGKEEIKNELFSERNEPVLQREEKHKEKDISFSPRTKTKQRSIQVFEPEVDVVEYAPPKMVSHIAPKEHIDALSQTKVINEISEKLKGNVSSQLEVLKAQMEQQQKYLIGELNNLKLETKEALNQKALTQNELTQLKSELEARKKVEARYEQEITNALNRDYNAKSRPDSKDRALMSRGENNNEMKNYQKLFFDNFNRSTMKLYDKSGETISATSSLASPDQSLKGETKIIQLGCIDPNKSLYMANSINSVKHFKKNAPEASLLMNSSKAIDTLDLLDRIAGVPRGGNPVIPLESKDYSKERSSKEDRLKMPKYVVDSTVRSEGLSSLKLQELNKLNNQRLEELSALGYGNGSDEIDKLDNLLLDIIRNKKDNKSTNQLNAIDEMELEDSLKENPLTKKSQPQPITTANLNLSSLKSSL